MSETTKTHIASFAKTYITVFLTLYLYGIDHDGFDMFNLVFIGDVAKYSLLAIIRTAYKLLAEK